MHRVFVKAFLHASSASAGHQEHLSYYRQFMQFLGIIKRPLRPRDIPFPGSLFVPVSLAFWLTGWSKDASYMSSQFPPNVVRNQKYNIVTFLPMVLIEQFKFFFNLYFLMVAMSQLIPPLQIGYLFTYFAPLAFVLLVTISKEASDDYQRFKRDQEA
eukprot:Partr_v1_DN28543_c0_g2_i1_m72654 putative ATPase class II type